MNLCMTKPTLIDLNQNELHYDPVMVSWDRSHESCNTFDNASKCKFKCV